MIDLRKYITIYFILLFIMAICSCSTARVKSPSGDLETTVREFYELKRLGKFQEAWHFERMSTDENEERRENSRTIYVRRSAGGILLEDFEILEIGQEGSGIEGYTPVKIKLVTDWPPLPFPVPEGDRILVMEDLWEKIDGRWYHVVRGMTKFW